MLVALDANIWISERMLKSSFGAAFLYALHQTEGKILLTDPLEKEIAAGITRVGEESLEKVKQGFVTIQTLTGNRPDYELPSGLDFKQHVYQRFLELENLLCRVQCNINHYQSAINRVISKKAPNSTREQYRDSLLWEIVVECADKEAVHLITNDADFFEAKKFSRGLAHELKSELQERNGIVFVYQRLDEFLSAINKTIVHPDRNKLSVLIDEAINSRIKAQTNSRECELGELKRYEIEAFLTERQEYLALSFTLIYSIFNITHLDETAFAEAELVVKGDSIYSFIEKTVSDIKLERMDYCDLHGKRISGGEIYNYDEFWLGLRNVPYIAIPNHL